MSQANQLSQQNLSEIEHATWLALKDIRYGSVEIIVHDSKVVQIERKEKVHFEPHRTRTNR